MKKLLSVLLIFQLLFYSVFPTIALAAFDDGSDEGGGQEYQEPPPDQEVEEYFEESSPAETQQPEIPQEPAPVEEEASTEPQTQAKQPLEAATQIANEQAEMSGASAVIGPTTIFNFTPSPQLQEAREEEVPSPTLPTLVQLPAVSDQVQEVVADYQEVAQDLPAVDATAQTELLAEYENSGETIANIISGPTQEAREGTGGTVLQNLVSEIEATGITIPEAVSETIAASQEALSQVPETISGILNLGYEEQLANQAAVAEQQAAATQAEQQERIEAALNAPEEQAQAAKQALGLDANSPDDLVISTINQKLGQTGFTMEGDLNNLTLTGNSAYSSDSPDYQNLSLSQRHERLAQGQAALQEVGKFAANFATGGGFDVAQNEASRSQANKTDLDDLERLRQGTGFSPPFGVIDPEQERLIMKFQGMSEDDLKAEIDKIRTQTPDDATFFENQLLAQKAYTDRLAQYDKDQMQRIDDGMKEYAAFVILNTVGAKALEKGGEFLAPYTQRVTNPIINAAGRVKDFVGGLFRREASEVGEEAVQIALQKGEPVFAQTLVSAGENALSIGTRQNEGFPSLTPFEQQPPDILLKTSEVWQKTFGTLSQNDSQSSKMAQLQVIAEWLAAGKTERELVSSYFQAIRAMVNAKGGLLEQGTSNAIRYNSRLSYEASIPNQLLDITDSLLLKGRGEQVLRQKLDDAAQALVTLKRYAVDNGADKTAFTSILRATNPENVHIVTPAKLQSLGQPSNTAGLYVGSDKQLLIRGDTNASAIVVHECIHAACGLTTSDVVSRTEALNYQLGSNENRKKLVEGLTEWANLKAYELQGKQPDFISGYGQQVSAVEKIIQKMQEGGYVLDKGMTRAKAEAKVIEAAVSGYYGRLYEPLGKGNEQKGQQILRDILDNTPATQSNMIDAQLPLNVPEKVQILTPKEKALIVGAGMAVTAPIEFTGIKMLKEELEKKDRRMPFNLPFIKQANAQSPAQNNLKGHQIFDVRMRLNLVKHAINNDGFVSTDFVENVLKSNIVDPSVVQTPEGYVFTTGETGSVSGKVENGDYIVKIPNYKQINVAFSQKIEVRNGDQVLPIGIAYSKTAGKHVPQKSSQLKISAYAANNDQSLKVLAYYDQHENGKWDNTERPIPWAGVQVKLEKVDKTKLVNLNSGWNLITLTAIPATPLTASSLLSQIAKQGGYATSVANLEDGKWQTYVQRGDKSYSGQDFPLIPGKAYFIKNLKKSVLIFEGQDFAAPVKLDLEEGWNTVGLPKTSQGYTINKLIDKLNSEGAVADAASRWESGLWDSFVKKNQEKYGEDFVIEANRGYIIKVEKETQFAP